MKASLAVLIALISLQASAHFIEGIRIRPGTVKTKLRINGVKTDCKVSVGDFKNLMEEDKFGNPAFKVPVEVEVDGGGVFSSSKIRFHSNFMMTNMFDDGV